VLLTKVLCAPAPVSHAVEIAFMLLEITWAYPLAVLSPRFAVFGIEVGMLAEMDDLKPFVYIALAPSLFELRTEEQQLADGDFLHESQAAN